MDYADKFVIINVRNQTKQGYKIFSIDWYSYFKTKVAAQKAQKAISTNLGLSSKIRSSANSAKYLVLITMPTKAYPKNFQKLSSRIRDIVEQFGGEYDGYEFGMIKPSGKA